MVVKMVRRLLRVKMAIIYCATLGGKFQGKFLSQVAIYISLQIVHLRKGTQFANVQELVAKMGLTIKTIG